ESARAVDSLAYTVGRSVVFGAGQYSPKSNAGQQLIAHELTHVLQQSNGRVSERGSSGGTSVSDPNDSLERQADEIASHLSSHPTSGTGNSHLRPLRSGVKNTIQRQATRRTRTTGASSRGAPIIEDSQRAAPGQMHQTEFLTTLRDRLIQECDAELAPFGRSARGCPYILRTIENYAARPVSALLRLIQHFAHPPTGADAQGLMNAVVQKARTATGRVARTVAEKGEQRLQAMSESGSTRISSYDPWVVQAQLGSGHSLEGNIQ